MNFQRKLDAKVVGAVHGLLKAPPKKVMITGSPETPYWKTYLEGYRWGVERRQQKLQAGQTQSQIAEFARSYITGWTDEIVLPLTKTMPPGWREAIHHVALDH